MMRVRVFTKAKNLTFTQAPFSVFLEPLFSESQAQRVMRSIGAVLSWYRSTTFLFHEPRFKLNTPGKKLIILKHIRYRPFIAYQYDVETLVENLGPLFPQIKWDKESAQQLINRTKTAKLHAEAVLMGLAFDKSLGLVI
jgi:hypothetical protein